jgi:hypothetical protein
MRNKMQHQKVKIIIAKNFRGLSPRANGGTAPPIFLSAEDGEYSAAHFGRFTRKE